MAVELKRFSGSELLLSQEQAWKVLRFFWPETSTQPGSLTQSDVGFAQGLLVEAVDGSYNMGFVEQVFQSFYMKVPTSFADIRGIVKEFAKSALKHWFRHATGADLKDPKIYESVRATLARNFRSAWRLRQETGELTY
jgi:hypothetical protein